MKISRTFCDIDKSNMKHLADGGYTEFGDWSECSEICGQGTQNRTRTCTNPAPANGGADCVGEAHQNRSCVENDCPGLIQS